MENEIQNTTKKKKPFIVKFLLGILIFIAAILIILIGWFSFCSINRKDISQAIPANFTIHVRTDSAWDALEPILDLKAVDYVLADPGFSAYRELFLTLRESTLRENFLVKKALQRRIDITVYDDKSYLITADMGFLSGATRVFPLVNKFLKIENLSYIQEGPNVYYLFGKEDSQKFFIKIYKNLVILTTNKTLFEKSITFDNKKDYLPNQLLPLTQNLKEPFRISADGVRLLTMLASSSDNAYIKAISSAISKDEFSTISFELTDTDLHLKANFPFLIEEQNSQHPVAKLIQKESTVASLLNKLPQNVQYYTFLNSLSLEEIVNAGISVLPPEVSIKSKWQVANNATQMLFNASLEDLLYSWTDTEFAMCGLEGKQEPIIAIKIKDEKKRQDIFENVLSSITFKSDNSLLIDGIRLPRISMPSYLQTLLVAFGLNIPEPYYIIKNDYVYFSASPENLVSIYNAGSSNRKLSNSDNWTKVSTKQTPVSTVSLYYNLERSIPFFLKSKTTISDILKLYNIGRFDISTKDNKLTVQLQAIVSKTQNSLSVPGFPVKLSNSTAGSLCKAQNEKSKSVFWIQDKSTVSVMNTASLEINSKNLKDINYLIPVEDQKSSKGELWAASKNGAVYLLTKDLDIVENFPIYTNKITTKPVLYNDELLCTTDDNLIVTIKNDGTKKEYQFDYLDKIQSSPGTFGNYVAIYEKSFIGGIHLLKDFTEVMEESPYVLDGLSYGSPVVFKNGKKVYTSIITQNGTLYLFDEQMNLIPNFPLNLQGLFYINVKYADNYIYALSATGTLYRIGLDGEYMQIAIPNLKAKSGNIYIYDYDDDKQSELFICGEGNTIYGFKNSLDLLEKFPVPGFVNPIFTDVTGDKISDCITLSIDHKLNAYNLRS